MSNGFINMCKFYSVDYDKFIRTTDDQHVKNVLEIWNYLLDKQLIYKGEYFKQTGEEDSTSFETYYFNMSSFQDRLKRFFNDNEDFIWPNFYSNKIKSMLNHQLKDVSISRNDTSWGITVPGSNDIVYVWFDALIGYLTRYKDNLTNNIGIHVIGKDILRFHAILWMSMLMALDMPFPDKLLVHGWILDNNVKISKSLYNYLPLNTPVSPIASDIIRYYLINSIKFGFDCEYSSLMYDKACTELKYILADVMYRVLSFWKIVEDKDIGSKDADNNYYVDSSCVNMEVITKIDDNFEQLREIVDKGNIHQYSSVIIDTARIVNRYIVSNKPWYFIERMPGVLYTSLASLIKLALMAYPVSPNMSMKVIQAIYPGDTIQLNYKEYTLPQMFKRTDPVKIY